MKADFVVFYTFETIKMYEYITIKTDFMIHLLYTLSRR